MKTLDTKFARAESINELIKMIGSQGRNFFYDKEKSRLSLFVFSGKKKRLWFFDKVGSKINPYQSKIANTSGFSEGGTLWSLMHDMREYILTGEPSNGKHGYSGLLGEGWGYSKKEMDQIVSFAKKIGFIEQSEIKEGNTYVK
ncbi:hypothetical protein [Terribacillus saccharophilus]|uniref:hypothetical protein n=1 Tax=Terribacillus saccharophilus TaxID=361277 RepID=UPI002989BC1C|nr:hypothetical protein [Terribacillus saccharophilus]MCM3227517.1 hypothetical protein [Terribacillus saccharophilus]